MAAFPQAATAGPVEDSGFERRLESVSRTGVVHDRVLPLARLERLDGSEGAPAIGPATWRQAVDELRRASFRAAGAPDPDAIARAARAVRDRGAVPLAILDLAYERLADGSAPGPGEAAGPGAMPALVESRAFAAAALAGPTHRGAGVTFLLERALYVGDPPRGPRAIEVDFGDGLGFRRVRFGEPVAAGYATTGPRTLAARVTRDDGTVAVSRFAFEVAGLATPSPDDTLAITASTAWQGQFGTGRAFVYRAPGRTQIENPVVVVEGFDLDNSMGWDELYALLNRENLLETLRADGFDAVVLDFTDATEPVQKNGLVVAELIQQVQATIAPQANLAVVGASMGGLCSRYALLWLEANAPPHRVRAWLSFDAPHAGADIPLGLQYWIRFFASQSADAAAFLAILDRPAARQMLVYHYTNPPGATGAPDPMRAAMLSDFAALGDWPALPRRLAVANGSGARVNQGFAPAAPVIRWNYTSLFVDITGNVWALPDAVSDTIFAGRTRILFTTTTQTVIVSGTRPWDGAPGGWRASFAELDALTAPYGDIVALHPHHCFVPSVSALALATPDPFFDIAGAPDLLALTPFDAVFYPASNEEHVFLTAASAAWIRSEIESGVVSVAPRAARGGGAGLALAAGPHPFSGSLELAFDLPRAETVTLEIFSVDGRAVRRLARGAFEAGPHRLMWDGRDGSGTPVPAGLYFARLTAGSKSVTARAARLR